MANDLCQALGIEFPIVLAPMGGAVGPDLCAAVSNAGGLGLIPLWWHDPATVRREIEATRALTTKPFGVNLNLNWPQDERLDVCLDAGVPIISLFWGDPLPHLDRIRAAGALSLCTCANSADAKRFAAAGADVIVAQGWEAGGHVRGTVATLPLVPAVVDAVAPRPVIAAGGIADGRGLAAVLALGASAGWIGTRFLASAEATVHAHYRKRLYDADEDATYYGLVFDVGWPDGPHRTLRNETIAAWERAGRPPPGKRPGEGDHIAKTGDEEVVRYAIHAPKPETVGDIDALPLWAGQGVGLVTRTQPAADIVREIWTEAQGVLAAIGRAATG